MGSTLAQLEVYRDEINTAFQKLFDTYDKTHVSAWGDEAWDHLDDFTTRTGKRIRGALTLHAYRMFGGSDEEAGLKAALAVELIQNYLLIVDDVMDRSDIRRGKSTIHEKYMDSLPKSVEGDERRHMSNMLAVNVGLIASHMANELLAECSADNPQQVLDALQLFNRNIAVTAYGQIDDLYSPVVEQTRDSILLTHKQKNSYYTFINPLQIGAILAGASVDALEDIVAFGEPAGIAFQVQDDLIGLYGDPKVSGKSDLDDLKEGKVTLFIQQALEKGDPIAQAGVIRSVLGKASITDKEADEVREIIDSLGVKKAVTTDARKLADEAKEALEQNSWPKEGKEFLYELMDYIVQRLA